MELIYKMKSIRACGFWIVNLDLSTLKVAWAYERLIITNGTPLSITTFRSVSESDADVPFSGLNTAPKFLENIS